MSQGTASPENVNDLLRRAIKYLKDGAASDSSRNYRYRVYKIKNHLLEPNERKRGLDRALFNQVKTLVDDQIATFSPWKPDDSNSNIEALYREDEDPDIGPSVRAPRGQVAERLPKAPSGGRIDVNEPKPYHAKHPGAVPDSKVSGKVQAIRWFYGGPDSSCEYWNWHYPNTLPFGEDIYMEAWESLKIDFDLAEGSKKLEKKLGPVVRNNVPYSMARALAHVTGLHDSGSRFKLPTPSHDYTKWLHSKEKEDRFFDLDGILEEVNQGGLEEDRDAKGYLPRIFLPQVKASSDDSRPSTRKNTTTSTVSRDSKGRKSGGRAETGGAVDPGTTSTAQSTRTTRSTTTGKRKQDDSGVGLSSQTSQGKRVSFAEHTDEEPQPVERPRRAKKPRTKK